jgi:hypothetical protein
MVRMKAQPRGQPGVAGAHSVGIRAASGRLMYRSALIALFVAGYARAGL